MNIFKERLKQLRNARHETQDAVGAAIGVSRYAIHLYEKGSNFPEIKGLIALADHFNVSIDYLVGRTDKPEVNR